MAMFMVAISGFSIGTVNAYEVGVEWTNDYGFWYNDPDEVDFALYSGHGSPTGFYFNNDHDDKKLRGIDTHHDAEWGDLDLEWIALACCEVLKNSDDGEWYERWGYEVFKGLHQIEGFDTSVSDDPNHGETFADYMIVNEYTIKTAGLR